MESMNLWPTVEYGHILRYVFRGATWQWLGLTNSARPSFEDFYYANTATLK